MEPPVWMALDARINIAQLLGHDAGQIEGDSFCRDLDHALAVPDAHFTYRSFWCTLVFHILLFALVECPMVQHPALSGSLLHQLLLFLYRLDDSRKLFARHAEKA